MAEEVSVFVLTFARRTWINSICRIIIRITVTTTSIIICYVARACSGTCIVPLVVSKPDRWCSVLMR